jgi:hypothetical protein
LYQSFGEVGKQCPRHKPELFPLGEPNGGFELPSDRNPVPPEAHLSVKAKLFHYEPHARYMDAKGKHIDLCSYAKKREFN